MKRKRDYKKFLVVFNLFLIPLLFLILIIMINNYEKYSSLLKTSVLLMIVLCLVVFTISFVKMISQKRIINSKNLFLKISFVFIFFVYVFELGTIVNFVYYNNDFKDWLITSSFGSLNYKGLAEKIYSKYTIDDVIETEKMTEPDLIDFSVDYDINLFANSYEKEVLDREEGALYKIIKISGRTSGTGAAYVGYLCVIYDPSHVKLAKSTGAGTFEGSYGERLDVIAKKNNAVLAINAGGFYDPNWNSNGGIPHGDVFINGELDSTYRRAELGGGIIGFDKNNKLVLRRMSTEEAYAAGIRDAVDWGPYLIVNGVNKYKNYQTYWEVGRTAIGQREDGIVLFLVIDNLQNHSKGVSYTDEANILEKYGAVNAANLDGGTSTMLWEKGEYINSPWNGVKPTFRRLPNAWIVTE